MPKGLTKEQARQIEKQRQQELKRQQELQKKQKTVRSSQLCTVVADSFCNGHMAGYSCIADLNGMYSRMRAWEAALVCIANSPVKAGFCRVMSDQKSVCGQTCKSTEKCIAAFAVGGGLSSACVPTNAAANCND